MTRALIRILNHVSERAFPGLAIASGSRMNDRVDQVFLMSQGTMRRLVRPRVWLTFGVATMCLIATVMLGARSPQVTTTPVKFDVVSIKPCAGLPPPGTGRGQNPRFPAISPGYAQWGCVTVSELVNQAYAAEDYPLLNVASRRNPDYAQVIRGGPAWVYSERFAIEGKAADGADRSTLTGPMLRAMLDDRFQLKLHRVTEEKPMYALTVLKAGINAKVITPTAPDECWVRVPGSPPRAPQGFEGKPSCGSLRGGGGAGLQRYDFTGATFGGLAAFLSTVSDRYVLDKTGVDGKFNIPLAYQPDDNATIFKAVEALGLRLEPTRGPTEYLQIERVQRPRPNVPAFAEATAGKPLAADDQSVPPPTAGPSIAQDAAATQVASNAAPQFDVVSIKPCPGLPPPGQGRSTYPGYAVLSPGFVHWECASLRELIEQAYAGGPNLSFFGVGNQLKNVVPVSSAGTWIADGRVRGGPSWVEKDRFAIEVKLSNAKERTREENFAYVRETLHGSMRAMLEARFQLKVHRATEEKPMYALTVAKGGLDRDKIKPAAAGDCREPVPIETRVGVAGPGALPVCGSTHGMFPGGNRRTEYTGITFPAFALWLSHQVDRFVLDQTGVDGRFSFVLEFAIDDTTPGAVPPRLAGRPAAERPRGDGPRIFQALEALGLKLEPTKGPAEFIQIDSVQRPKPDLPASAEASASAKATADKTAGKPTTSLGQTIF